MAAFSGSERFKILRQIGSGGMGIVYEAYDTQAKTRVALKTLQRLDQASLYLFKNEFRSLTGIAHPNLVPLFELFSERDQWYFTMELIEGVSFLEYVRSSSRAQRSPSVVAGSPAARPIDDPETAALFSSTDVDQAVASAENTDGESDCDCHRLRSVVAQVVHGLCALHAAGKLHRDIKPSNVLVTSEGQAVILDFGLISELNEDPVEQGGKRISGTVAYMSPEQAGGERLTQASDWYSVGVMMYEALTGTLPFSGTARHVLLEKRNTDPAPPSGHVPGVPEDLDRICLDLLSRDPELRPLGRELLARLHYADKPQHQPPQLHDAAFIGRTHELGLLHEAFAAVGGGQAAIVYIRGESGVGKSALTQRFLQEIRSGNLAVLAGRCYEQESVPYKALDSSLDALGRYLQGLTPGELAEVLPRDVQALAQVFPVLRGVEIIPETPDENMGILDSQELRRRAFEAFRELLSQIARHRLVILQLDDLHWGDADSAMLLLDVLRPPDPPPILVLCAYRSGYEEKSPFLRALLKATSQDHLLRFDIQVGCLDANESQILAQRLSGTANGEAKARSAAIAKESGGHPYFIIELTRSAAPVIESELPSTTPAEATLDFLIWKRVSSLPDDVRQLLEVIALSGQPLTQLDAYEAAGLRPPKTTSLITLRNAHLVRTTGNRELDEVETYHDRIRETIVGHLSAGARQTYHLQLAATLEASGRGGHETLAVHFESAGQLEKAARYYTAAADQAVAAVAFDRAVYLYRRAIASNPTAGQTVELQVRFGDALANAGRGLEAAQNYEQSALRVSSSEILALERKAAYQYCISGHIDEGLAVFRKVLARVNLRLPRTRLGCIAALAVVRARLLLRGLHFRETSADEAQEVLLNRIDVAWSVGVGLLLIDVIAGMSFLARSLLLALQAGEPQRIARSLTLEAPALCTGQYGRPRSLKLLKVCGSISGKLHSPEVSGRLMMARGIVSFLHAHWADARKELADGERILGEQCTGVNWELATVHMFSQYALHYLGRYAEMSSRAGVLLREARKRCDLYEATNIGVFSEPLALLAADSPEAAQKLVLDSLAQWSRDGYHQQRSIGNLALAWIHLYMGDGRSAWKLFEEQWPLMKKSLLLIADANWIPLTYVRGISAVGAADGVTDSEPLLRSAERDARKLEGQVLGYGKALAKVVRAGVAGARSDDRGAIGHLEDAMRQFEALDMGLMAATARRRLGELTGGDRGESLILQADQWMRGQNIQNPVRMTAMYVPGFRSI